MSRLFKAFRFLVGGRVLGVFPFLGKFLFYGSFVFDSYLNLLFIGKSCSLPCGAEVMNAPASYLVLLESISRRDFVKSRDEIRCPNHYGETGIIVNAVLNQSVICFR